jgi:arabinosaccharide transport system substrate-binding protein
MKLMPLPAWTRGGRRTSVWGGTMLGIPKSSPRAEEAWAFGKDLYLNPDLARNLFETNGIISPVRAMWSQSFYDAPNPFYSGQPAGRLYIGLAGDVPLRTSSPYNTLAKARLQDASVALRQYAEANDAFDTERLMPEARRLLAIAESSVRRQIDKNVFLKVATKEQP